MDFLGIVLSLVLLIILVYRGVSILIVSPLMAMLAVLFSNDMPMIMAWTGPLMTATAGFIRDYFPVFLVGAIFGLLMSTSGCAKIIALWISKFIGAKRACMAVIIASFLLVYGGVSVFVVVFAVLPIAENIFLANNMPRRLIPSAIIAGAMPAYAAPGAAQFINTIPIPFFNTTIYSGFISGVIATVFWIAISIFYMENQIKKACQSEKISSTQNSAEAVEDRTKQPQKKSPSTLQSIFPILLVVVLNYIFTVCFELPSVKLYFAPFGGVQGIWPITISLSLTIVFMLILLRSYLVQPLKDISRGAADSLLPIFNTAIQVGYGGVIKQLSAFATIKVGLLALAGPKLVLMALIAAMIAGMVGSASGGTGIVMQVFSTEFIQIAQLYNISNDVMHRVIVFGANILGTLPHSGLIITLLGICGLTHRESYKQIFVVSVVFPFFATLVLLLSLYIGL